MCKKKDLTGMRFGRLVVLGECETRSPSGRLRWDTVCDCGCVGTHCGNNLKTGDTQSCGCLQLERIRASEISHGLSHTQEYRIWSLILHRCRNPNSPSFRDYGGRGIGVCERWVEPLVGFTNFMTDMGPRPSAGHSVDRIDNNQGYSPENCRWATRLQQNNNGRRNRRITWMGETKTVAEWSKIVGIHDATIRYRLDHGGMTVEEALTSPVKKHATRRSRHSFPDA